MKNITLYSDFLFEDLSSVSKFLKAQYNNIFQGPDQALNNIFVDFTKKVDTEKNVFNLYQRFIKSNQTIFQTEVNAADTIDAVNKIIIDEIKYFYFSLKPIVNKLQNDEFTMEKIFEKSRDKRLMKLMSYPEDQFSNAVQQYVSEAVLPEIKKDAGLDKVAAPNAEPAPASTTPTTERIKYNIYKILEVDQTTTNQSPTNPTADLLSYKKSALKWVNMSLFDLLKPKMQLLTQLSANTSNDIDSLSKQIKGTPNDNAKKMILNKIINMNKEELQNLANTLGITQEELGKL